MKTFIALILMAATALGAVPSQTDFDSTYFLTSSLPISVTGNLTNWQKLATNVTAFTAMTGTVSNNVASAGLLSVDATKTNGIAATASHIISTLGFTPANSNSVPSSANPTATVATTAVNGSAATFMRSDAAFAVPASFITANQTNVAAANPTASVGASVVNGSAATFMRSDAAPALASGAATNNIGYVPVNKAGDSMTGTLSVTGLTNSARTASTFVVAAADKSDVSTATSAILAATLSDETGTGAAVFGTAPFLQGITTMGSTSQLYLTNNGSSSSPVIAFTGRGTNWGIYSGDSSTIHFTINGNNDYAFTSTARFNLHSDSCQLQLGASADVIVARDSAATLQLGLDGISPINQTLKSADGSGTDKNGANLTLESGQSTGTGTAGLLDISTGLTGEASGSGVNAYSIRAHYKPKFVALTHTTATTIETFSLAANKLIGGTATVTCYATNSTPHLQALTSTLIFQAVAVSTTITATLSQVDGTTAADSGTLTCTYTIADNGDNTFSIKANANSSLSSPTERAKVVITALNGNAAISITDP